jgi:hypothetical protein
MHRSPFYCAAAFESSTASGTLGKRVKSWSEAALTNFTARITMSRAKDSTSDTAPETATS